MTDVIKLEFYVPQERFNENKIEMVNIFNNVYVHDWSINAIKKYIRSPKSFRYYEWSGINGGYWIYGWEAFVREIDSILRNQLWSRCQYEVLITGFPFDEKELVKMDAYQLCKPNLDMICHGIIRQYKNQIKEVK